MVSVEIVSAFAVAAEILADPLNVLLLLVATGAGVLIGMLPGLGGTVVLALLIPLTFSLDPLVAFMVLAAANGGTAQGGAVTAILINTPGKAANAASILDGYPMARQGRAGEAIGASATASALGAILGLTFLTLSIPVMIEVVLLFGAPEIFWLGIWGLTVLAVIVRGSVVSGLISGGVGLLIAMHGLNSMTATFRWTYGLTNMQDGFRLVPSIIGIFAVAEMISLVSEGEQIDKTARTDLSVGSGRLKGVKAVLEHKWIFFRSSLIGMFIGVIPGVGGVAANYIAYFQASQTAADPDKFGTGDVRGLIASESSNDAKDGGAYIPTLGFGIPGSASMAVLLGAFLLHGIVPGPLLLQDNLGIATIIILAALASNIVSSAFVLLVTNPLIHVTRIDIRYLAPVVLGVAFFGSYALANNIFNVYLTLTFGILGFLMIKANVSRVPLILGMVLGPIVERNFFRSLQISQGEYGVFLRSPVTVVLVLLIVVSLLLPYVRAKFARGSFL